MKKPLLIATLGYPGSGKTYFSERLAKEYRFFHLNSDKIRLEIFPNPTFTLAEHEVVFRFIHYLIEELLGLGVSVICDANSNKKFHRNTFVKQAKKYGARYVLVHINTPVEVAEKRLIKRRNIKHPEKKKYYRPLDLSVLHEMRKEIEYPDHTETVLEIDGRKPYSLQAAVFKKWMKNANSF